ncbi:MAG: DUF1285 domain-containing protein [Gammaproteobacteria bacterium]|nr:DUF1285 domain-containing protein [Gammaproteobacteria bacterium]MDH3856514.1 DUF1285 domain-containing protein [Gammaproteobacteria bacterium]
MSQLDQILANIRTSETTRAARRDWNPRNQGEIDIRIAADGNWFHEGRPFRRDSMVKLFAGILRREGDEYFLVTPAEKLRIQVDDAPFVANLVDRIEENGQQAIVFTTNTSEQIIVDRDHPVRVDIDTNTNQPRPYVHFREGLDALISRSAFYDLLNLADETERDGAVYLSISSMGEEFELGSTDE